MRLFRTYESWDGIMHDVIGHAKPSTLCGLLTLTHDNIDNHNNRTISCVACIGARVSYDAWEESVTNGTAPAQLVTRQGRSRGRRTP